MKEPSSGRSPVNSFVSLHEGLRMKGFILDIYNIYRSTSAEEPPKSSKRDMAWVVFATQLQFFGDMGWDLFFFFLTFAFLGHISNEKKS